MEEETATEPQWSTTVRGAAADVGDGPVTAGRLIGRVLDRHRRDYAGGEKHPRPGWPGDGPAQTAADWLADAAPLFTADEVLHGRQLIVALAVLDQRAGRVAFESGVLWRVATEGEPIAAGLSPLGKRLLSRRHPLVAACLGVRPPEETRIGEGPAIDIAFPPGTDPLWDRVGRYAAAWRTTSGELVEIVRDGNRVAQFPVDEPCLAWWRRTLLAGGRGGLRMFEADLKTDPEWGHVRAVCAGESGMIAVLDADGRLRAGALSDQEDATTLVQDVVAAAGAPDTSVVVYATEAGEVLSTNLGSDPAQVITTSGGPVVELACGPGGSVVIRRADDVELVHDDQRFPLNLAARFVTSVAAGPGRLVAAGFAPEDGDAGVSLSIDGREVAYLDHPGRVERVAIRSDGAMLGTACDDGFVRLFRLTSEASELRFGRYDSDAADGEDLLRISATVNALATLIAAHETAPPLSVGLFGPWGSGKTFFLRKLRDRVDEISEDARASAQRQSDLWAWRDVRQIWFNAWTYAGGDVWAGLVEQLLRELAGGMATLPEPDELQQRQFATLEALATARARREAAETERQKAEDRAREARNKVQTAQNDLDDARVKEQNASKDLTAPAALSDAALSGVNTALRELGIAPDGADVTTTLATARRTLSSGAAKVAAVDSPEARDRRRRLTVALLAGPAAALVAGLVVYAFRPELTALIASVSGIAAALQAAFAWVRGQAKWIDEKAARIAAAEQELADARREKELALAEARERAESKAAELREREAAVAGAEAEEARAQSAVEQATPERVFADYLADRVVSDDYRRHLGILGLVRRDLDVISKAIETHNAELLAGKEKDEQRTINRIVLYVDDLDRCAPEVVVRVLEAVHLLLAYPIFVVVVAVDPEWVSRSLRVAYPDLVKGAHVTPEDYLEKIFQLPLWLEPLQATSARDMIAGLLGIEPERAAEADGNGRQELEPAATPDQPRSATVTQAAQAEPPADARENLAESPPASLELTRAEQEGIAGLAPLLTRSPRALKRYLNTYRLLKARTDPEELRTAQLLLALAIQRRVSEATLFETITAADPDQPLGNLVGTDPVLEKLFGDYVGWSWREAPCARVKLVAGDVQRFTFGLERNGSADESG